MSKINLVISPSQQAGTEENLIRPISQRLYDMLLSDDLINVTIVPDYSNLTDSEALVKAVDNSNSFINENGGTGYHLEIHADAGGYATGASGLYVSELGKAFITPILQEIMNITPWEDIGLRKRTDLYALNQTIAYAGLIELSFYDNAKEYNWMVNEKELIAKTLKNGIYRSLSLQEPVNNKSPYVVDLIPQGIQMQYFDDHLEVRVGTGPWKVILYNN